MNWKITRLALATILLVLCGSATMAADGGSIPPLCMPNQPCPKGAQSIAVIAQVPR